MSLFAEMFEHKVKMTGTVRKITRAGIPNSVKQAQNPVGSASVLRKGPMLAISFRKNDHNKIQGLYSYLKLTDSMI